MILPPHCRNYAHLPRHFALATESLRRGRLYCELGVRARNREAGAPMKRFLEKQLIVVMHRFEVTGGQERSTYEVLTRLARMGWQIEVYSFTRTEWPAHLSLRWRRVPGITLPSVFLRALWFRCWTWLVLRKQFHSKSPRPLFFTLGVDSFFADVRCVQFLHSAADSLIRNGKLPHPNVRTFLHKAYQQLMLYYHVRLERRYLGQCRALVAISRTVESDIRRLIAIPPDLPVALIHHAPDNVPARHTKKNTTGTVPSLLFVGTLERKGIEKALRYLSALREFPWHFSVLGDGNQRRWEALAEALGISERVTFLGHQSASPFFAEAEVLLLPSLYEPFGLVVSEAVSFGCLPLASSECGAMELWEGRPEWMKISAFAEDREWIEALRKLIASADLRRELSASAIDAFGQWSWDAATLQYESTFMKVTGGRV